MTTLLHYLKLDWETHKKQYLLFFVTLPLVIITMGSMYLYFNANLNSILNRTSVFLFTTISFLFLFMILTSYFSSTSFPHTNSKEKTINYLTLPISFNQKFWIEFTKRNIVFPLIIGCIVFGYISIIYNSIHNDIDFDDFSTITTEINSTELSLWFLKLIITYFSYLTFYFAASTFFKKNKFIKVIFITFVFNFIIALFNDDYNVNSILYASDILDDDSTSIPYLLIALISSAFHIAIAYFNIKEQEV